MGVGTRERIMEAARLTVQDLGYGGLSFRELAKEVGIKSASIHYYFPTKGELGVAIVSRYIEHYTLFLDGLLLDGRPGEDADRSVLMRHYTDMFRSTLLNGNRLCLAGMLAAERNELPAEVRAEVVRWGEMNERWLARVLADAEARSAQGEAGSERESASNTGPGAASRHPAAVPHRARAIFAAVSGAQMIAHGRNEVAIYDDAIAAYRASGLIP